jgi:hypothetical protein
MQLFLLCEYIVLGGIEMSKKPINKLWRFTVLMKMLGVVNPEEFTKLEKKIKSQ